MTTRKLEAGDFLVRVVLPHGATSSDEPHQVIGYRTASQAAQCVADYLDTQAGLSPEDRTRSPKRLEVEDSFGRVERFDVTAKVCVDYVARKVER